MNTVLNGIAYGTQICAAAARHHLDPRLLAAVAAQETGGPGSNSGRNVVGDGGHGRGLFQIDDRFHPFAATPAAMNPASNAEYAAGMLQDLLGRYHGDVHRALSAYNAGDPDARGTVTQWQDGRRLGYADSVMRHYADLSGGALAGAGAGRDGAATASRSNRMSFLGHIVHGIESGVTAFAETGNPLVAAGVGVLGACAPLPQAGGADLPVSAPQLPQPLVSSMRSESQSDQRNVNALSDLADLITSSSGEDA